VWVQQRRIKGAVFIDRHQRVHTPWLEQACASACSSKLSAQHGQDKQRITAKSKKREWLLTLARVQDFE
jgi:hypothetical protein